MPGAQAWRLPKTPGSSSPDLRTRAMDSSPAPPLLSGGAGDDLPKTVADRIARVSTIGDLYRSWHQGTNASEPLASANSACAEFNWASLGGESGRGARPLRRERRTAIRDPCAEALVPFFFKQWFVCQSSHLSGHDSFRWSQRRSAPEVPSHCRHFPSSKWLPGEPSQTGQARHDDGKRPHHTRRFAIRGR